MRIIDLEGTVGITPEPKHGKNGDFVKFRLASKEYSDDETWWFTVLCYGKQAVTVLKNVKVGQPLRVVGNLLAPRNGSRDGTVRLLDFSWQRSPRQQENAENGDIFDFGIEDFESIPEIPYGDTQDTP